MRKLLGAFAALGFLAAVSVGSWWVFRPPPPEPMPPVVPVTESKPLILDLSAVRTAAVIDFSRTPVATLFENKVLGSMRLTWVERAQVDKVIAELELQALFSAEGASKRAGLGKLLKADLFILLRTGESLDEKKTKHLEIAICESKYGLRVATGAVPLADDQNASISALEGVLDGALAKLSEKITDVCAVPPFISNDLDYRHDHLKAAYARVLEHHLLARKGILLVELAEAQAVAREVALAGEGKVERWLPLYFLGGFRHEGKGDERRALLDLKVQRGNQTIGSKEKVPALPNEASKVLGKLADELADQVLVAGAGGALDTKAEIQQLLTQSSAFERLGNWSESLAMLETALLLDPDQPDVNLRASHAGAMVYMAQFRSGKLQTDDYMNILRVYRRAAEHLELSQRTLVKQDPPLSPNNRKPIGPSYSQEFSLAAMTVKSLSSYSSNKLSNDFVALFKEVMAEERERYLRITRLRVRLGTGDDHRFATWATESLPQADRYPLLRELILEFKDMPHAKDRTMWYVLQGRGGLYNPQALGLAEELAKHAHPELKAAGEELLKYHAEAVAKAKLPPAVKPRLPNNELRLVPIDLQHRELGRALIYKVPEWLAAGPNLDFFFSDSVVYMMKDRGIIDGVWSTPEMGARPHKMCYDGRYLWFSVYRSRKPSLLVVADPKTLATWEFTADDGLPLSETDGDLNKSLTQSLDMAPLSPGRVCVVGSFGRTWIGIATFDPERGKSVKIFHEAREAVEAKLGDLWSRPHLAFSPFCVHVLEGPGGAKRVLIGRQANDYTANVQRHPLLVDPDKLTVEVVQEKMSLFGKPGQQRDGGVYYVAGGDVPLRIDLQKLEYPAVRKTIFTDVPHKVTFRILVDDDLHVVTYDQDWYHASLKDKDKGMRYLGRLGEGELTHVGLSSHYGLFVVHGSRLHQVQFRSGGPDIVKNDPPKNPMNPIVFPPAKPKNEPPKLVHVPSKLALDDPRLNAMISYHFNNHGSVEEVFGVFTRHSKVKFRLADAPKDGKAMAGDGFLGFGSVAHNMIVLAERSFTDGRWEKDGDGYVLHGRPKVVWTPKDFADADTRQKEAKKANAALKDIERLGIKISYGFNNDPPMDEMLDVVRKATGLPIRLAETPKEGTPLGISMGGNGPVSMLMQAIAERAVFEGKWEKDGDGYRLVGRPRRIMTLQAEAEAYAKKKAFEEAVAKAKAKSPGGDPKLQVKLTVKENQPKLPDMLKRLEDATGLRFTLADDLKHHDPTWGGVNFPDVHAGIVMNLIATTDMEKGRWVKTDDGYRLEGVSISSRPAPRNTKEVEKLWASITYSPDPREYERAIRGLAAAPDVTLPFIKERLRPVKGPDQKQFAEFRTRLHNGDPAVSEAARKELLTMELNEGTYNILEVASRSDLRLKKALIEVKARLDKSAVKNDRTLATHAVRVLARIGDDEARRQLEALAAGAFAAAVTSEAQGALTRLNKGDGKK